jgi:hypothetical protein
VPASVELTRVVILIEIVFTRHPPRGRRAAPLSGISISLATLRGSGGDAHIVIDPIVYSSTV